MFDLSDYSPSIPEKFKGMNELVRWTSKAAIQWCSLFTLSLPNLKSKGKWAI